METQIIKLKVKRHGFEFELEGDAAMIARQLELINYRDKENPSSNRESEKGEQAKIRATTAEIGSVSKEAAKPSEDEESGVNYAKYEKLNLREREWVLLYCYLASDKGKRPFQKKDIKNYYEQSGRDIGTRVFHIRDKVKVLISYKFITPDQSGILTLNKEGIEYIEAILKNKKGGQTDRIVATRPRGKYRKTVKTAIAQRPIKRKQKESQSLTEFCSKYDISSMTKAVTVIVYYLQLVVSMEKIDKTAIYSSMDELNIKPGVPVSQAIYNAKNRKGWVDYETLDNITISVKGTDAVLFDLPKQRHRLPLEG